MEDNSSSSEYYDKMKANIIGLLIDDEMYKANTYPSKNNIFKCEARFLSEHGIKNDSDKAEWIRNNYCSHVVKNTLKDCVFSLDGISVKIMSVQCKSNNDVYYLLVKQEQNGS